MEELAKLEEERGNLVVAVVYCKMRAESLVKTKIVKNGSVTYFV